MYILQRNLDKVKSKYGGGASRKGKGKRMERQEGRFARNPVSETNFIKEDGRGLRLRALP